MSKKWTNADLRKRRAIDRIYTAYTHGMFDMNMREFLVSLMHDLLSWSPYAEEEVNTKLELDYLREQS